MLKQFRMIVLVALWVVMLACQGTKQVADTPDMVSSTTPAVSPEATASNIGSGPETSPQTSETDLRSADDAETYEAARTAYETGASLDKLGQHEAALSQFKQAAELFEEVVQKNPGHFKAMVNWGSTLSKLGQPAEAILKFQQALALAPQHINRAEALYNWGTALERLGRHQEAIEKFDQAVALKADLLSPALQGYLYRHRPRQPDSETAPPGAS